MCVCNSKMKQLAISTYDFTKNFCRHINWIYVVVNKFAKQQT